MYIKKIFSALNVLWQLNIWKTIYINFHYFPSNIAIHFPIFIYRRTELHTVKGKITLETSSRPGIVEFGIKGLGTRDIMYTRTMWTIKGTLIIKGKASIGRGSKISIGENATLTLGYNFRITGNSEIVCERNISFGNNCLLSWDILIMDSDFHNLKDKEGKITNKPKPILIGNHVWIGCRATLLKGINIGDENIISAGAIVTKSIKETHCIIGCANRSIGIIREGIQWEE